MGKGAIIGVVATCVIALVVLMIIISISVGGENSYCNNWGAAIDSKNAAMQQRLTEINNAKAQFDSAGFWDTLNFDTNEWNMKRDQYNADLQILKIEVDDYNRQCAY